MFLIIFIYVYYVYYLLVILLRVSWDFDFWGNVIIVFGGRRVNVLERERVYVLEFISSCV